MSRLPDSPKSLGYREIYEFIQEVEGPERIARARAAMERDFWFYCAYGSSMREWRIDDPAHPRNGELWIDQPFLFDLCREIQETAESGVEEETSFWWNLPRLHLKTTIITQHFTCWELLKDPQLCVAVMTYKVDKVGQQMFDGLVGELTKNPVLLEHWPDRLVGEVSSTKKALTIVREVGPREPSISLHSIFNPPTSGHYDRIIVDDPVTKESVDTQDAVNRTFDAMRDLVALDGLASGRKRFIGTIWGRGDAWDKAVKSGLVVRKRWTRRAGLVPDSVPWDCYVHGDPRNPQLLSSPRLAKWRREYGEYRFSCFPSDAPVLMANWTEKPISEIRVGDEVVGYPKDNRKSLVRSRVTGVWSGTGHLRRYFMESGREVVCTPDHKWYTGRQDEGSHRRYAPLADLQKRGPGSGLQRLRSVVEPIPQASEKEKEMAAWLGGFFDGEGSLTGHDRRQLAFTQSRINQPVIDRLTECLDGLGFTYGTYERKLAPNQTAPSVMLTLKGGQRESRRFLELCRPTKWREQIIENLYRTHGMLVDPVLSFEDLGEAPIYNIETETGNYVAYGYATKNCQMRNSPVSKGRRRFLDQWLSRYRTDPYEEAEGKHIYGFVDLVQGGTKGTTSDFFTLWTVGLGGDRNYYLLDLIRERIHLGEIIDEIFRIHQVFQHRTIFLEPFDSQHAKVALEREMEHRGYRFQLETLPDVRGSKESRIEAMIPFFERRFIWAPAVGFGHGSTSLFEQGDDRDTWQQFLEDEYRPWSPEKNATLTDDMLDALAWMFQEEVQLMLEWPARPGKPGRDLHLMGSSHPSGAGRTPWSYF